MKTFPRTIAASGLAALLLAGCGSAAEPEPAAPTSTGTTTPEPTTAEDTASPAEAEVAPETASVAVTPPAQAEAGLLIPDVEQASARTDAPPLVRTLATPVVAGTFGTPAGTLEIRSVETADTLPGALLEGGTDPTYIPAEGEEFFVFDINFVPTEDDQPPAAELHLNSEGAKRLVTELSPGESTFVASLPSGADGAQLLVSSDGHDQVFDIAAGARLPDPLTDVYLRPVTAQDLTEVLSFGPTAAGTEGREFTGEMRMRSARITPYVPPRMGSQGWAEPGSMWLILDLETSYDSSAPGWSEKNATLSWTVEGAEKIVQEGRLWSPGTDETVVSIPADAESIEVEIANRLEASALSDGRLTVDLGSQSFTLSFPNGK